MLGARFRGPRGLSFRFSTTRGPTKIWKFIFEKLPYWRHPAQPITPFEPHPPKDVEFFKKRPFPSDLRPSASITVNPAVTDG